MTSGWTRGDTAVCLAPGAELDPALTVSLIEQQQISVAHFVPTVLRLLVDRPAFAASMRDCVQHLFHGGEAMSFDLLSQVRDLDNGVKMYHLYGPTETTISMLNWDCKGDAMSIGHPIDGMTM